MNKARLKLWLGAGVSVLALTAMSVASHAQDAPAPAGDTGAAKADETVVVISTRRKALKSAIEIKKDSDTIVDSVVADEAGNLPDASITEVLQRVSGVTVSRFSSSNGGTPSFQIEGTGVTVRGLPYNSSTLNGRQAFSANGASSLMWDEVTPELMGGVDVYKASRADIIEGGASTIDLRTRLPFDYKKPAFEVSTGASYGDLSGKTSPEISGLLTRRFDTGLGEMGVLVDIAHSQRFEGNDDAQMGPYLPENNPTVDSGMSLVPTGFSWSQGRNERSRDGLYAAFQWRPADNLTLTSTLFYSQKHTKGESRSGGWGADPGNSEENIPVDAVYDSNGAMLSGSLYVGAVGVSTPVFGWGGNNFLHDYINKSDPAYDWIWMYDWSPDFGKTSADTILTADCRAQYGDTTTGTPTVDWGKWAQPGMFYCQQQGTAGKGRALYLGGGAGVSDGTSSTLDFSNSFVFNPNDTTRIRGALQFVISTANSRNMGAGITQRSDDLTDASFDVSGDTPQFGGFNAEALVDTDTAHFSSFSYNGNDNKGSAIAANIDVDQAFNDDHFFKSISYGARLAVREERDNFIGTYWAPLARDWVSYPYPDGVTGPSRPYLTGPKGITGPYTVAGDTFQAYMVDANGNRLKNSDGTFQTHNVTADITVTPYGTVNAADYELYGFPDFFRGESASPGTVLTPSLALLQNYDWAHMAAFSSEATLDAVNAARCKADSTAVACDSNPGHWTPQQYWNTNIDQGLGVTNTSIRSKAAYVETKFGSDGFGWIPSFSGNLGVRVIAEYLIGDGNFHVNNAAAFYLSPADMALGGHQYQPIAGSTPRHKELKYERVLPSLNVKFKLSPERIVRFAASQGVSQPNLGDIRAGGTLQPTTQTFVGPGGKQFDVLTAITSRGAGADFKPITFTSFDLSYEWYPKNDTYAYVDLFAKDVKNQDLFDAYYQTQATPLLDVTDANHPVEVSVNVPWFFVQNRTTSADEKAKIRGVEIGGRTFFDFLPSPLDGFGISGNVTYVDSENPALLGNSTMGSQFVPAGISGLDPNFTTDFKKLPYYGMSRWTYNFELYYSKGAFNTRLAYNWHSKQLMSTNANPLSYIGRGGSSHYCTACVDDGHGGRIWDLVPLWSADAGYLDYSVDYRLNQNVSFGLQANNLTNTKSKTLQEPLPGVFERYDTYLSDRRVSVYLRLKY